jgi:hypothetical protein
MQLLLLRLAELAAAEMALYQVLKQEMQQQTPEVAGAQVMPEQRVMAAQALSFFATPVQFNISLVAQ